MAHARQSGRRQGSLTNHRLILRRPSLVHRSEQVSAAETSYPVKWHATAAGATVFARRISTLAFNDDFGSFLWSLECIGIVVRGVRGAVVGCGHQWQEERKRQSGAYADRLSRHLVLANHHSETHCCETTIPIHCLQRRDNDYCWVISRLVSVPVRSSYVQCHHAMPPAKRV